MAEAENVPQVNDAEEDQAETAEEEEVLDVHEPEMPVKIRGRDGVARDYVLRELNGTDLAKWMAIAGNRVGNKKRPTHHDYEGIYADLVAMCLHDQAGRRVPKAMVSSWGPKIQSRLFVKCQKLNGLGRLPEEEEGKG